MNMNESNANPPKMNETKGTRQRYTHTNSVQKRIYWVMYLIELRERYWNCGLRTLVEHAERTRKWAGQRSAIIVAPQPHCQFYLIWYVVYIMRAITITVIIVAITLAPPIERKKMNISVLLFLSFSLWWMILFNFFQLSFFCYTDPIILFVFDFLPYNLAAA